MKSGKLHIVNPTDCDWTHNRYVLSFGAYGATHLMCWANDLQTALDEAIDYIAEHLPGLLCDDQVFEEHARLVSEGMSEDRAMEQATADMTCAGNAGHYVASWEWALHAENPTRAEIKQLQGAY